MSVVNIIERSKELLDNLQKYDKVLYDAINDILSENTKNGIVSLDNKTLAQIEDILLEYLKDTKYFNDVDEYLKLFSVISNENFQRQVEINNLKLSRIKDLWQKNSNKTLLEQKALYYLKGNGLKNNYIQAVGDLVREQHFLGQDFKTAKNLLKEKLVTKSISQRYVNQTVIDTMRTYSGAFNDEIKQTFGFKNFLYVGDLLETSRPFCTIIVDKYKGRVTEDEMKKLLNEYCPNGTPSESKILIDGNKVKKGAGMYKDTTIDNICTNCGGFGCRHDCYPTK